MTSSVRGNELSDRFIASAWGTCEMTALLESHLHWTQIMTCPQPLTRGARSPARRSPRRSSWLVHARQWRGEWLSVPARDAVGVPVAGGSGGRAGGRVSSNKKDMQSSRVASKGTRRQRRRYGGPVNGTPIAALAGPQLGDTVSGVVCLKVKRLGDGGARQRGRTEGRTK